MDLCVWSEILWDLGTIRSGLLLRDKYKVLWKCLPGLGWVVTRKKKSVKTLSPQGVRIWRSVLHSKWQKRKKFRKLLRLTFQIIFINCSKWISKSELLLTNNSFFLLIDGNVLNAKNWCDGLLPIAFFPNVILYQIKLIYRTKFGLIFKKIIPLPTFSQLKILR